MAVRRFNVNYHVRPDLVTFEGVTNEEGEIFADFAYFQLYNSPKNGVGIWKISIPNSGILNVENGKEYFLYEAVDGTVTRYDLPDCRIVSADDLIRQMNNLQAQLLFVNITPLLHFDLNGGTLTLSANIARSLRLIDPISKQLNFQLNPLHTDVAVFSKSNKGEVIISSSPAVQLGDEVNLPYDGQFFVYDLITDKAPGNVYIYSDLVEDQIVSGTRVPLLAIIPLSFEGSYTDFVFPKIQLKKASNKTVFARPHLQLAFGNGKKLKNLHVVAEVVFKRIRRY